MKTSEYNITLKYGHHFKKIAMVPNSMDVLRNHAFTFIQSQYPQSQEKWNEANAIFLYVHNVHSNNFLLPLLRIEDLNDLSVVEIITIESNPLCVGARSHKLSFVNILNSIKICSFCHQELLKEDKVISHCIECEMNFHLDCSKKMFNFCQHMCPTENLNVVNSKGSNVIKKFENFVNRRLSRSIEELKPGNSARTPINTWCSINSDFEVIPEENSLSEQLCLMERSSFQLFSPVSPNCREIKNKGNSKCIMKSEAFLPFVIDASKKNRTTCISSLSSIEKSSRHQGLGKTFNALMEYISLKKFLMSNKAVFTGYLYYKADSYHNMVKGYWIAFHERILIFSNKTTNKILEEIHFSHVLKLTKYAANDKDRIFCIKTADKNYNCGMREAVRMDNATTTKLKENGMGTEIALVWYERLISIIKILALNIEMTEEPEATVYTDRYEENQIKISDSTSTKKSAESLFDMKYQTEEGEILGAGSFGTVFPAFRKEDHLQIAIKFIKKSRYTKNKLSNLLDPSNVLQNFKNPFIINVIDVFEINNHVYEVMERQNCDLLQHLLVMPNLSEKFAKCVISQVIIGLKYLHDQDIAHCDIKPENILTGSNVSLSGFPQIKICDFENIRLIKDKLALNGLIGTPGFWAPEIKYNTHVDKGIDLWSLGVLVYVCLTLKMPLKNIKNFKNAEITEHELFPSNLFQNISAEAKSVISSLLKICPDERITLMELINHPWVSTKQNIDELKSLEELIGEKCLTEQIKLKFPLTENEN